jgi:hypothetical protein
VDGARRFPQAALALALEPGWLEVLGLPGEFFAADIEGILRLRREPTLAGLRAAEVEGLVEGLGRKGSKGGPFRWAVTGQGVEVRAALLELVDQSAGRAAKQRPSPEARPRITALMAVVDPRDAEALKKLEQDDLYAELRGAVEELPASATIFRVKLEGTSRKRR